MLTCLLVCWLVGYNVKMLQCYNVTMLQCYGVNIRGAKSQNPFCDLGSEAKYFLPNSALKKCTKCI